MHYIWLVLQLIILKETLSNENVNEFSHIKRLNELLWVNRGFNPNAAWHGYLSRKKMQMFSGCGETWLLLLWYLLSKSALKCLISQMVEVSLMQYIFSGQQFMTTPQTEREREIYLSTLSFLCFMFANLLFGTATKLRLWNITKCFIRMFILITRTTSHIQKSQYGGHY